jgi:hypothetical protein
MSARAVPRHLLCEYRNVAGFDAERYLRLTGEWVREGGGTGRWPRNPVLAATAAALVAVDAMTFANAQALIADYDPTLTRSRDHRGRVSRETGQLVAPARPDIGQLRVVPCERVIDLPGGRLTIHYVAFACHATTLRVALRLDEPSGRRRSGHPIPAWARRLSVTDSRGTTAAAEFSGSARIGDRGWHGQYEVHPQLAAETAWIELLGERVELTAQPAGTQTWVEPLPAQDPAVRHLWERVATLNDFHDPHLALNATIAALVAARALETDAPVIDEARAVLAVLRPGSADPAARPAGLAEPWRSLLARWGQTGGPVCTIAVSAVPAPFDGVTAAVIALESRDEHFGITVELVPDVRTGLPYGDVPDQPHLTWWAVDDLGNYYLGEQGSWNPGGDPSWGSIGFWPALDKRATSIDLIPTATAARAVIRVPCARTPRANTPETGLVRKSGRPEQENRSSQPYNQATPSR